ncbi:MAG: HAD hydrolase family protein [Bacteroidales bacterium]|jgi:3-deoxy-D-manno-octulosonate 8-phosphate phosphatase (KDO 8-P phosphatase)|nr:HAD hydrolase family protein [Bacteroidales bacterium]
MNYKEKLHNIKAFVFDYDGVFTNGYLWIANKENIFRSGNVKDGYVVQYAIKKGYKIAIISGGKGESILSRTKMLQIEDVFLEKADKKEVFLNYLKDNNLKKEEVLYMGDDIPDYDVMLEAGIAACPKDAVEEIKNVAHYISHKNGGDGCVRDVIEQVLRLHNKWFDKDSKMW